MGTGYTRNDTSNNIADGNIINAADLDGEFDAIESAFSTSGHTHDGTSAEGGPITVLGPVQDFVASATEIKPKTTNTLDIGTSALLFKDMYLDGVATLGSIKIDNAGTIGSASDSDAIAISSSGVVTFSQAPFVDVTNATTNAVTDVLGIQVQSSGTPAVGIGSGLTLGVETASGNVETAGAIRIVSTGLTPTDEEIDLVFYSMRNGSLTEGFRYDSSADSLDVTGSLDVNSGSENVVATFTSTDTEAQINLVDSTGSAQIRSRNDLRFFTNGGSTRAMDIDSSGDVGIGTTTPSARIHAYHATTNVVGTFESGDADVYITLADNTTTSDTAMRIGVTGNDMHFSTSATERLQIDSSGKVTIQTPTSGAALEVNLIDNAADGFMVKQGSNEYISVDTTNGSEKVLLGNTTTNPKVGIGTTSPTVTFDVKSTGAVVSTLRGTSSSIAYLDLTNYATSGNGVGSGIELRANSSTQERQVGFITAEWTDNTDATRDSRMDFDININGGTTAALRLGVDEIVVNEGGHVTNFRVESDSESNMLFVDATDNRLGIRTNDPASTLHIDSDNASGTTYGIVQNDGTANTNTIAGWVIRDGTTVMSGIRRRRDGSSSPTEIGNFSNDEAVQFLQNNESCIKFNTDSSIVVNEGSYDKDFRVEGANNTHLFFVDAGQDEISMGTSANTAYDAKVAITVSDAGSHTDFQTSLLLNDDTTTTSQSGGSILFAGQDGSSSRGFAKIVGGKANSTSGDYGGALLFKTRVNGDATIDENMRINGSGIVINELSSNKDFRVEADTYSNAIFLDASTGKLHFDNAKTNFGGITDATADGEVNMGLIKLRNSNTTSGDFLSIDAEGTSAGQAMVHYWYDGSYRNRLSVGGNTNATIVNESGLDVDFRIESDNETNAFFLNGANGRVGLSESNPQSNLHLTGDGSEGWFYINNSNATADHVIYFRRQNSNVSYLGLLSTDQFWINGSNASKVVLQSKAGTELVVNESGNDSDFRVETDASSYGFLVDAGTGYLAARGGSQVRFTLGSTGTSGGNNANWIRGTGSDLGLNAASGNIHFEIGGTERMRIEGTNITNTGSGSLPSASLQGFGVQDQTISTSATSTSARNHHLFYNGNGQVGSIQTSGSATSFNTSSDYRLKENVVYDWDATTRLKQLKPARFNFIADADTTVDGFLAHEAQTVVPEAVTGTHNEVDSDGNAVMQGIDQSKLVPLLVKTIQELEARITALENA